METIKQDYEKTIKPLEYSELATGYGKTIEPKGSLPVEMLNDIILTFLLGVECEAKDIHGNTIASIIVDLRVKEYVVEWGDLFRLRKSIVSRMKEIKDPKVVQLANAIEKVHLCPNEVKPKGERS